MSGQANAGQEEKEPRPRRRSAIDGRIVTNVPASLGGYICEIAEDLGISPSTVARMLMVEALKGRGITMKELEARFPSRYNRDKRLRSLLDYHARSNDDDEEGE